jgi:hypothetical protein
MHDGQGQELPTDCGYVGQWISKPTLFLCTLPDWTPAVQFTPRFEFRGRWPVGFVAEHLARLLGVSAGEVLALNRRGTLTVTAEPPASDASEATFHFSDGKNLVPVTVQWGGPEGHA